MSDCDLMVGYGIQGHMKHGCIDVTRGRLEKRRGMGDSSNLNSSGVLLKCIPFFLEGH